MTGKTNSDEENTFDVEGVRFAFSSLDDEDMKDDKDRPKRVKNSDGESEDEQEIIIRGTDYSQKGQLAGLVFHK